MLRLLASLLLCAVPVTLAQTPGWQPGDSQSFVLDKGDIRVAASYNVGWQPLTLRFNFKAVSPTDIYVMTEAAYSYFARGQTVNVYCGEQKMLTSTFACQVPAMAGNVYLVFYDRRQTLSAEELIGLMALYYGKNADLETRLRAPNEITYTPLVRVPTPEEIAAANAPHYEWREIYKNKATYPASEQVRAININLAAGDQFDVEVKANSPVDLGVVPGESSEITTADAMKLIGESSCSRQDTKKASFGCTAKTEGARRLILATRGATKVELKIKKLVCTWNCDKKSP
jgi:hypothetical protein